MATSEREELGDLIRETYEAEFGARASHREVFQAVLPNVPQHIRDYIADDGIRRAVTQMFNAKSDGLPFAPVVNEAGEHVPFDLMEFSEYEFVATGYVRKAAPLLAQARRVADEARDRFGRVIEVDGVPLTAERAA